MKQEERILRALGNVKDSYVLEVSQYMNNPQKGKLVRPRKRKNRGILALGAAAAAALVLTGTLGLLSLGAKQPVGGMPWEALSAVITVSEDTTRSIVLVTEDGEGDCQKIQQIQVYDGDTLTQTIDAGVIPEDSAYKCEGLFINLAQPVGLPDCRDLNFDGYTDIGFMGAGDYPENVPYRYFLWNPETERFEYGFDLYGATALEVDPQRRILIENVIGNGERFQCYYSFSTGNIRSTSPEALEQNASWPTFRISFDPQELEMTEGLGGMFIVPRLPWDNLPTRSIQIEFLPGLLPYAAMEKTRRAMADERVSVQQDQETGRYNLHLAYGNSWDSTVEDVTIVGAGSSGSYRLTSRYFLEATEGWGSTFGEIVASFICPLSESVNPEAEQVIMDFVEGYFSGNRITMLANYYGDSQNLKDVYTQDASRVRLVALKGLESPDRQIEANGFGAVSLTFLETEDADSYTYLSMDILKTQAGYRVGFYGLEK